MSQLCATVTKKGAPCSSRAVAGKRYCHRHRSGQMCGREVDDPMSAVVGCCILPRGHSGPHGTDYPHGMYQVEHWEIMENMVGNYVTAFGVLRKKTRKGWTVTVPFGSLGRVAHRFVTLEAIELANAQEQAFVNGSSQPIYTGGAVLAGGCRIYRSAADATEHGEVGFVPLNGLLPPRDTTPEPKAYRDVTKLIGKEGWALSKPDEQA